MNGVLIVDKKEGLTSRDVVNQISKIYHTKKVGHTGTLDPMASGILILCLGTYTKLVNELSSKKKEYIATMKLGIHTDTFDITGNILKEENVSFSEKEIKEAFLKFPKKYMQQVPIYSAVKVKGKKLYEYARNKEEVELPKKEVEIYELEVLKIKDNEITFKTVVSKGTYIRSLIVDLAKTLNTYATMTSLRRTKIDWITVEDAYQLDNITPNTPLLKIDELFDYLRYEVTKEEVKKIQNGNALFLHSSEKHLFLTYEGNVIALYEKQDNMYRMKFKVI